MEQMEKVNNLPGRLICFSDMHGCYVEFRNLINKIHPKYEDSLYVLGDAFDRNGKDSAMKVWKIIKEFNMTYIFGNHDSELFDKIMRNKEIKKPWYIDWWHSFSMEAKLWFLNSEKYYRHDKNYDVLMIHAGVDPYIPWWETDPRTLCTIQTINMAKKMHGDSRRHHLYEKVKPTTSVNFWTNHFDIDSHNCYEGITIVYGHSALRSSEEHMMVKKYDGPNLPKMCVDIDLGCVHGRKLAAIVFNPIGWTLSTEGKKLHWEYKIYTVDATKDYYRESYKSESEDKYRGPNGKFDK